MNILFVSAFPPNSLTAGQNYSLNLLEDLCSRHEVDLIYWAYEGHSPSPTLLHKVKSLKEYSCNSKYSTVVLSLLMLIFPLYAVRFSFNILKTIKSISSKYDMIYFDFSQIFIYSLFIKHPNKVMMCHDVISQKYARTLCSFLYHWWVIISERRVLRGSKRLLCFSAKDKQILDSTYNVTSEMVSFYIDEKITKIDYNQLKIRNFFCFYGAWNRPENSSGLIWFLDKVWGKCNKHVEIKIIGGGMPQSLIQRIEGCGRIKYLGFVDDPYKIIAESVAVLAPLFSGAGVKVKVIESMALGTPVIGTDIAFEGIDQIEYNNGKKAQMLFDQAERMIELVNEYSILIEEKKEIRNSFLSSYSSHKFIDML